MDWTIGKKRVSGRPSPKAGGFTRRTWRQGVALPALALLLVVWAATPVRAGMAASVSDVTIANQAILPSSAPTAVLAIDANATGDDATIRGGDSLVVSFVNTSYFNASQDIVAVYLFRDSSVTSGTFNYDNIGLGSGTSVPNSDGIYPINSGSLLVYYATPSLNNGNDTGTNKQYLGTVSNSMNFSEYFHRSQLPGSTTGANAGADYFIVIQTSDDLEHRASFQVRATYTPGKPPETPPGASTATTNTLTCEYYAQNMTDRSGYHGWSWGMVHLGGVDGMPFSSGNIMGIDTPYLLFGLNVAGRSGLTNSSYTTEYLTGLEVLFTGQDSGSAMYATHQIASYPSLSIWEDTNNNGYFDPSFEVTSGGSAGGDRLIGPADAANGNRVHTGGKATGTLTRAIDGIVNGTTSSYDSRERTIDLEATADNQLDFFVCLATDPSHIWVSTTPVYGDTFQAALNDDVAISGYRSINFWYARQSGEDKITQTTKRVLDTIRAPQPNQHALGDPEDVEMTIGVAINATSSPNGMLEADGFPEPIFNFNLCDGHGLARNEAIEQIRVWFEGKGFKPTDLMPLTDDEYSGVSLWWDNKPAGMSDAENQLGQFDPPQGVTWLGQTENGQALHSTSFTDINLPLSSSSLTWYNGGDNSPWSPYNDTGPDYYVVLKPKAPISMPPVDYDWQNDDVHGHRTIGDSTSFVNGSAVNFRGPDLFICVRANGMKNADYGENWWERGMDEGDQMIATIKSPDDIVYSRAGVNTSWDQLPATVTQGLGSIPLAYNVLTDRNNFPITPFANTAVVGINLVAPDRSLYTAASVWRTVDLIQAGPDGSAVFTVAPRGVSDGDVVTIRGTTYYSGNAVAINASGTTFEAAPLWVQTTFSYLSTVTGVNGPVPLAGAYAAPDGSAVFMASGHGLSVGEFIRISGATNYNGLFVVKSVATDTFQVAARYAAEQFTGATVAGTTGSTTLDSVADTATQGTIFAAPGHTLSVGEPATISGTTNHNGLYVVVSSDPAIGTFTLGPRYVGEAFASGLVFGSVSGVSTLESVASGPGEVAVFTAPGHQLSVDELITILGTTTYDGLYVVTASDIPSGTFQAAPRYVAETFGNIDGTLITEVANISGKAGFHAPGQSLSIGDIATVGGTMRYGGSDSFYAGSYAVVGFPIPDYILLSPPCLPTALTGTVYNSLGTGVALTASASAGDGSAEFTAPGHTFANGDIARIVGTSQYDGEYVVTNSNTGAGTLQGIRSHLAETFANSAVNGTTKVLTVSSDPYGAVLVTAPAHGFSDYDQITIANAGSYSGRYVVGNATTDTFQISPLYVAEQFATVNGTIALLSVTASSKGIAVFNAPGHGLLVDDQVTISGTGGVYDGTFTVTARTTNTFEVGPVGADVDFTDAFVDTTLQSVVSAVDNSAMFVVPDRTLAAGDPVNIWNTTHYDRDYVVTGLFAGTWYQLAPLYVEEFIPTINATTAITSVVASSGYARFTAPDHGLSDGDQAVVAGTTDYDGDYVALMVVGNTMLLAPRYQAETFADAAIGKKLASVANVGGLPEFTSTGHGFSDGDLVTLGGTTNYDGDFIVANRTASTFQAFVPYTAEAGGGTVGGQTIGSIAGDNGSALFTIAGHGFTTGDAVAVANTTNYNGNYAVDVVSADTFHLSPRYAATTFTAAVAGTRLTAVAAADTIAGSAKFTATGHGLVKGDFVWIGGSTNYDGHYIVDSAASVDTCELALSHLANITNTANVNGVALTNIADAGAGDAVFTAPGHGLAVGDTATITGTTYYDGDFAVTAIQGDTFEVGPLYIPELFSGAKIGTPLTRVLKYPTHEEIANFTAPAHRLDVDKFVSFRNTGTFDREYVVTLAESANDLQVSPRWVGGISAGATVNGLVLRSVSPAGGGFALFTTYVANGFVEGQPVTIQNTVNYDDDYLVYQKIDSYSFIVAVRCLTPLSGTVNGTALTGVYNGGTGHAVFVAPGHGLGVGDLATISGATSATFDYDGLYVVTASSPGAGTFEVSPRYAVQVFASATVGGVSLDSVATNPLDNSAIFSAPGNTFAPSNIVTISGAGTYNGTYIVTAVDLDGPDTFQVSPLYVSMELANVNTTIPLAAYSLAGVSPNGNQTIFTTAGSHGLLDGDVVTIGGTVNYDGDYVVVAHNTATTFEVARGCRAQSLTGATVNGLPLTAVSDPGDHSVLFTSPGHGLVPGDLATILNTGSYDGTYVVTETPDGDTFRVGPRCVPMSVADVGIGEKEVTAISDAGDRIALFHSVAHDLVAGDFVTINGAAGYDGFYVVTVADDDSFQLIRRYMPEAFATATIIREDTSTVPLLSVTGDPSDGSAILTAPGHGFVDGDTLTIYNTIYYNGDFVATDVSGDTFKLLKGIEPPPRIEKLVVELRDTGTINFDYSDLIDPATQHPAENQEGGGCGIAVYVDNPVLGQQGVFDEHDVRLPMARVPYIYGPTQYPTLLRLEFEPETVLNDPGKHLVGTGGADDQATGSIPSSFGLAADAVFQDRNGNQLYDPGVDAAWIDVNHSGAYEAGTIATSDTGANAGNDFFLVVRPTKYMDPGDDFTIQIYNSWYPIEQTDGGDTLTHSVASRYVTTRFTTNRLRNSVVTNDTLTDEVTPGLLTQPGGGPYPAMGINVSDPTGAGRLNAVRVYFNPESDYDPDHLLAPLSGGSTGGLSLWNIASGANISVQAGAWHDEAAESLVYHEITVPPTPVTAVPVGTTLEFFEYTENVCWADNDQDGKWSTGDSLWINTSDISETSIRYNHGYDTPLVATAANDGDSGVILQHNLYGFGYYDVNASGTFEMEEDIYYLGPGRSILGWYTDLVLNTPASLPTTDTGGSAGKDFEVRFRTNPNPPIFGTLGWTFSIPNQSVTYNTGHSSANQDLTTGLIRLEVIPTTITDFTASRGAGRVTLNWTLPVSSFTSVMIVRTPTTAPGLAEVPELGIPYAVGQPIGNGTVVYMGSGGVFVDNGVVNGTPYYYWAFGADQAPTGRGTEDMVQASPWPVTPTEDSTPPGVVTGLDATPGDNSVSFTWNDPLDLDLAEVLIIRSSTDYPVIRPADETAYAIGSDLGDGIVVGKVAAGVESFVDDGDVGVPAPANGTTYYYTFYTRDGYLNYSAPAMINCMPSDLALTDPRPVTSFGLSVVVDSGGNHDVNLAWNWPTPVGTPETGLIIVRTFGSPISGTPSTGRLYRLGDALATGETGTVVAIVSGTGAVTYTDQDVMGGGTYYYAAFTYNSILEYSIGAYSSQVVSSAAVSYVDLTTVGQTIEFDSVPTAAIGINVYDNDQDAVLGSVTVQFNRLGNNSIYDLATIDGASVASGVALYRDTNGNGVFNAGVDALVPFSLGSGWSRGTPLVYDRKMDTAILDLTNWRAVDGVTGIQTGVYYLDANDNGSWDPGEDIWAGSATFGATSVVLYTGGSQEVSIGLPGIQTGLSYYDEDGSNSYTPGESLWRDESWPRMLTMNLTTGLDVPNTDTGANAGSDLFVVVRTSHTIRYGTQIQLAVPSTFGLTFFGEEAGVAGLTTNAVTCRIPTALTNLVAAGQTISVASPSTPVIGMDVADPSQTADSLALDFLNVGGDFDITPSDFVSYLATDQEGPVSFWRDMRPVAPSSLGGIITVTAADGNRTQVRVAGTDFAALGVRVGDVIRRVFGGVTTTAAVTALQSTTTANDTLVFMGGLSGTGGDHSLDAGDVFTVEIRFLVASSPVINVANATYYPTTGLVRLGRELISYDGKDANNNLLNVVRGVQGTAAAVGSHPVGESLRVIGMASTLAADLTAAGSTVQLAAGEGPRFQNPGQGYTAYIRIGDEIIGYRNRVGDQLQQCTRGAKGTDAIPHIAGASVADAMPLTLLADLGAADTEIDVLERPFAPAAKTGIGHVTIGLEVVSYTSTIRLPFGWRLSGCVRDVSGTGAAAHLAGDAVVQGRAGTFDLESDSLVFLSSLPAAGMTIPLNIRNQKLSPMIDDIMDFFVTVKTSASASHNDDFQVRLAGGALDYSVSAASDSQRGITSNTLRVDAQDTTAPVITQVRTLDLNQNGTIDHVLVTFSEPVRDSSLTGYISEAIAFLTDRWLLQGYTGVGIDPNGTTGWADVEDDNRLVLSLDEKVIDIPNSWLGDTGVLLDLATAGSTLTDLSTNPAANLLNGGTDYSFGELLPLTVDGAAPVLVDAFSDRPLTVTGEIAAGTVVTLRFSEPVTSLDVARIALSDLMSSYDGVAGLANGFSGMFGTDVTAAITPQGTVALTFGQESVSGGLWTEDATLNLDSSTLSEGDIVDMVGFTALPAPQAVPLRGLGSVTVVSAETGDANNNGRIDFVRITFDRPVDDSTLQGYPGTGGRIDVAANGNRFAIDGRGQLMIDLDGPLGTDVSDNNVLYLVFGEGGAPDTAETPALTITAARLRSLDGEYTRDYAGATTDAAPPVMIDVVTYDLDENGSVETAAVDFSESVVDATADPGDFMIGGMVVEAVATGSALIPAFANTADDSVLVLQIVTPANQVLGTDYKTVAYTQDDDGTDLADVPGNEMVSDSDGGRWGNKMDGAKPRIQSARTLTDASVQVTFSETVLGVTTAMLKLDGGALGMGTLTQTGPRTFAWSDPAGNARWNTDADGTGPGDIDDSDGYRSTDSAGTARNVVPNLSVAAGAFSDAWGNANLVVANSTVTTDGTVPVVVSVATMDTTPNGQVDSALVVLSEPVDDSTLVPGQFAIGGSQGTTVASLAINDQAFTVRHAGVPGTELKTVAYVAGTLIDLRGNPLASNADLGFAKTDLAKPYLLSARSRSDRSMELQFSEEVVPPLASVLTVNGGTITFATIDSSANPVLLWDGADATWNTDATGTSAGLGTDATGTTQTAVLDLTLGADAILDLAANPNGNNAITASTIASDGAPPVVTKLYSTVTPGSTHTLGQLVPILAEFSERVTVVGGNPTLLIQVSDAAQRTLSYQSGSGTRALRFNYTVEAGDNRLDPDYLDCPATDSLAFGGSNVIDFAPTPNQAVLTLPVPGNEYANGGLYGPLYGHHVQIDTVAPEVLATQTVDDDTLKVTFSELIENDTDQIAAALPFVGISDGGTPETKLLFDAVSLDPDNTVPTNTVTELSVVYFHMTDAAKRWNTDATGTSAGVGTDRAGVVRTSIPRLLIPASVLSDLVANPIADTTFDSTLDGAPPVALGGLYRDANADGRVETLEVLFSEGVNLGATTGWALTPNDLPLDSALGVFGRPNNRTVGIAVSATGPGTGVDGNTEPALAFTDTGAGDIRDQSPAANAAAAFARSLADQAGPVLVAVDLATPGVARLTFSEKLAAATVDAGGADFLHSSSTITAAVTVNDWAGARLTLDPVLGLTEATTVRFASAGTVTDPNGNPNVDVATVAAAAYEGHVNLSGPATDVMHRGSLPIDVTGMVNVLNAVPEDDLDEWNLYLVQGQGASRLPIADASTRQLNGPVLAPVTTDGVLGSFTPDTDAVDGIYHYSIVLEVKFNTGEAPLFVYREVEIAKDLPEAGQVNDGAGADIDFQQSTSELVANWTGISMVGVSTASYEVAYSTNANDYPALPGDWTNVGLATSATLPALSLNGGTTYYVKVRALDSGGGVIAVQSSDGVTVDVTGPAGNVVRDGLTPGVDVAWLVQNHAFAANWDAFVDPGSVDEDPDPTPVIGSGVSTYEVAVCRVVGVADHTSAETDDVMVTTAFMPVGGVLAANLELGAGALIHGATYYAAVRATDGVGNVGDPVYSNGATVDLFAPQAAGEILDGAIVGTDIDLTNSQTTLSANWVPFTDDVSGPPTQALVYKYRVVTGLDDVTSWQTCTGAGALRMARQYFTSVRLNDGRLLVAGGWTGTDTLSSVEIFDPATESWTLAAPMHQARMSAAGAVLSDGRVVVGGGEAAGDYLSSIEIYDPATNAWTLATGELARKRSLAAAVALNNGAVWFMGGRGEVDLANLPDGDCISAIESFNPATGAVSAAGSLSVARCGAKAAVLADGRILVIGGETATGFSTVVDVYTPTVGWSTANLATARAQFALCQIPGGELMVIGGRNGGGKLASAERFNGVSWQALPPMATPRAAFGAVWVESENRVLVVGGLAGTDGSGDKDLASCETFDPATGTWEAATSLNVARGYHGVAVFENGLVLAYGGLSNYSFSSANECRRYAVAVTPWLSVSSAEDTNPITVTMTGLSLLAGRKYHVQVRPYDAAGNAGAIVASDGVVVDVDSPTVTVTAPAGPTNVSPLLFTVTFVEPVVGFDSTDLSVGNATVTPFTGLAGTTFQVELTPTTTNGDVTLTVPAGSVTDAAGNDNIVSNTGTVAFRSVGPACVLTGPPSPTGKIALPFKATFADVVTGFAGPTKINVVNGKVTGAPVSTNGTVFTFVVTPFNEGDVMVTVLAGAGKDSLGNNSQASSQVTVVYDATAPVAVLTGAPSGLVNVKDLDVTVGGTDVATYIYSLDGGPESGEITSSTAIIEVGLADGAHNLRVWGIDAAGNRQAAPTVAEWTVDTAAPTATLTGQPTSPSSSTALHLLVGGISVVEYSYVLDGAPETVKVSVAQPLDETGLSEGAHLLQVWGYDAAGNRQVAPTEFAWTVDSVAPTGTLTSLSGPVTFENPIRYQITFDEDVADFTVADLSTNGTLVNFVAVSAQEYTFGVVPAVARGIEVTVNVTLAAGSVHDGAGNACAQSTVAVQFFTEPPARITLVPSVDEVTVGETFEVSVYVKELSDSANGFRGGPMDLVFTTEQADVDQTNLMTGGVFDLSKVLNSLFTSYGTSGTLDEAAGLIDELGGVTRENDYGEGELPDEAPEGVLFAVVPFVATAPGMFNLAAAPAQAGLTLTPPVGTLPVALVDYGQAASVVVTTGVTLSVVGDASFDEEDGTATLRVSLGNDATEDVTVTLSFGGAAVLDTDYTAMPTPVVIASGTDSADVTLTGLHDTAYEGVEAVVVAIDTVASTSGAYIESGDQEVTVNVIDDDFAPGDLAGGDGVVGPNDLWEFISHYGSTLTPPHGSYSVACDFDGDGDVDFYDLNVFIGLYGTDYNTPTRARKVTVMRGEDSTAKVTLVGPAEVALGDTFTVQVYVETDDSFGFGGGALDVGFTTALVNYDGAFNSNTAVQDPFKALDTSGSLDEEAGLIDNLGGGTFTSGLGVQPTPALYATLQFVATAPGVVTFQSAPAGGLYQLTTVGNGWIPTAKTSFGSLDVTVTSDNTAPVADDLTVETETNVAVSCGLTASDDDGDVLDFSLPQVDAQGYPQHGTIAVSRDGATVLYTPDTDFRGSDCFTFTVSDGIESDTGTVTVLVGGFSSVLQVRYGTQNYASLTYGRKVGASEEARVADGDLPAGQEVSLPNQAGAYFEVSGGISQYLFTDYRPLASTTVWKLAVSVPANATRETWQIVWDGTGLPDTGSVVLMPCNDAWEATGDKVDLRVAGTQELVNNGTELATFRFLVVASERAEVTYALSKGWNLIGVPLNADADSIAAFLANAGIWTVYEWSETTGYSVATTLEAGRGYWVYALDEINLTLAGIPRVGGVALNAGWNLVSAGENGAQNPGNGNAAVVGCWLWNATSMVYSAPDEGGIAAASGVWIFVSEDTVIWSSR
jgi:hypothetical protein